MWGDDPPRDATNALQYHVSQLRKAIGSRDTMITQEPGYLMRVARNELDLFTFEQLVGDAQTAAPEDAARLLHDALELWRGPPLGDVAYADWAQLEIVRLEELRVRALELRIDADLALGRHAQVVGELEALVREHPLRERPRAALMRALYASGRQAEALEAYRDARAMLVDELGIEPSPELQELERAILRHDFVARRRTRGPRSLSRDRRHRPGRTKTSIRCARSPNRSRGVPSASSSSRD